MPRQREHAVFDEFDARAYSHLVPGQVAQPQTQQYSRKHEKRKKSKHKSHKSSRHKSDKDRNRNRTSTTQNPPVEILAHTSIVDYDDVSSESAGSLSDVSGSQSVPPGPSRVDNVHSKRDRDQSPASAIRSYMNERSHSNSPVIRESSPPHRTEKSARKSKKRQRSPTEIPKAAEPKVKVYAPKAYAEPPRAYADPGSKSTYRMNSPTGAKKRHRLKSPTSPYARRRSRSR